MKNWLTAFIALFCFTLTACQRPVAYFQRTTHAPAARLPMPVQSEVSIRTDAEPVASAPIEATPDRAEPVLVASATKQLSVGASQQIRQHQHRLARLLNSAATEQSRQIDQQPKPKPKPKMRLGNRIRETLGMPLRQELNWWQRISWKLKASVIIILVAVLFAILQVTILAIIFGIVGAFLLISGLRRSFKVRRPWF